MTTQSADAINAPLVTPIQPAVVIPPDVNETAGRLGVAQQLPQVIDLTRQIFGSFSRVTVSEDPEFLGDDHIIFHVPAQGTIDEDLDKSEQWGRRLMEIIPRSPQVYLVIPEFPS
jgi:hypothetical protein